MTKLSRISSLRKQPLLPRKKQSYFIRKLAKLLSEGYSLNDSISMLIPHHLNHIDEIEQLIHAQLIEGKSLSDILRYIGIPEQYLMSIYVAEQSGATNNALFMVAKMMEKSSENKAQVIKLASYPTFLFLFLIIIFISFRSYFLPNMESMIATRNGESKLQLTISTILLHLPDLLITLLIICMIAVIAFMHYTRKKKTGEQLLIYYKIPIVNRILKLQLTKVLAYEMGTLLSNGFSLQDALTLLGRQTHQRLIAHNAKVLLDEISQGESLASAVLINPYMHAEFYTYVAHGEQSGNLGKELEILSEFMNERIGNRIEKALNIMQPLLFCIIAICILGAYISIMLPMYDMINYV